MAWVLNDPPPKLGNELEKCQRYQIEVTSARYGYIGTGFAASQNRVYFTVPIPITLRSAPVMIWEGLYAVKQSVFSKLEKFSVVGFSNNIVSISGYAPDGENPFAVGDIYFLQPRGATFKLFFDSNL